MATLISPGVVLLHGTGIMPSILAAVSKDRLSFYSIDGYAFRESSNGDYVYAWICRNGKAITLLKITAYDVFGESPIEAAKTLVRSITSCVLEINAYYESNLWC